MNASTADLIKMLEQGIVLLQEPTADAEQQAKVFKTIASICETRAGQITRQLNGDK